MDPVRRPFWGAPTPPSAADVAKEMKAKPISRLGIHTAMALLESGPGLSLWSSPSRMMCRVGRDRRYVQEIRPARLEPGIGAGLRADASSGAPRVIGRRIGGAIVAARPPQGLMGVGFLSRPFLPFTALDGARFGGVVRSCRSIQAATTRPAARRAALRLAPPGQDSRPSPSGPRSQRMLAKRQG